MKQDINPASPSSWQFDVDFASEDPGDSSHPSDRSLHFGLYYGSGNDSITVRVVDVATEGDGAGTQTGDLQIYDGSAYRTVLANSVIFDTDVQSDPLVHSLQIVGHFDQASPNYDVKLTDSSGGIHTANSQAFWFSTVPSQGDGIKEVRFLTMLSDGDYLIDNVSLVPEPSALVLLFSAGLGGLLFLWRRRRA